MPVALGLAVAAFCEILWISMLWFARIAFLAALNYALENALPPIIARWFHGIQNSLVRHIERPLEAWVTTHLHPFTAWLVSLRFVLTGSWAAIIPFAGRVASAFEHLVDDTIPAIIAARVAPVVRSIGSLDNLLKNTLIGGIPGVIPAVQHLYDRLFDKQTGIIPDLVHGIDRLRIDTNDLLANVAHRFYGDFRGLPSAMDHLFDRAIPAITSGINSAQKELGAIFDVELPDIRSALGDIAKRIEGALPWVETVAATVGAAVAIEALRRVVRCGSKLDRMCTTDEDILGDLFDTLLLVGAFTGLEAFTREAGEVLEASLDAVRSLAE